MQNAYFLKEEYFHYLALTKGHKVIGDNFLHQEGSEISSITM